MCLVMLPPSRNRTFFMALRDDVMVKSLSHDYFIIPCGSFHWAVVRLWVVLLFHWLYYSIQRNAKEMQCKSTLNCVYILWMLSPRSIQSQPFALYNLELFGNLSVRTCKNKNSHKINSFKLNNIWNKQDPGHIYTIKKPYHVDVKIMWFKSKMTWSISRFCSNLVLYSYKMLLCIRLSVIPALYHTFCSCLASDVTPHSSTIITIYTAK
jgi:hypothetical protein